MSEEPPLIGVTGPDAGGWPAWIFTHLALARAGARAVRVTPSDPIEPRCLDGLVLGGGADVTEPASLSDLPSTPPPKRRARRRSKLRRGVDLALAPLVLSVRYAWGTHSHGKDLARDRLELALLAHARGHDMPVLGICRGAQLMNLAEQGTVQRNVQSLYEERVELYTVLPRREIGFAEHSRLRNVLGVDELLVNSLHFHAVQQPGQGMRIVAREPSGVAQAIEHVERAFYIGVQWHPEYLPQDERQQQLFRALVASARAYRATRKAQPVTDSPSLPMRSGSAMELK